MIYNDPDQLLWHGSGLNSSDELRRRVGRADQPGRRS
jgi:hypothetical protein